MPGDLPNPEETILATTASQVIPIQPSAPSAGPSAEVSNTTSTVAPAFPAPPGPSARPPSPPVSVQSAGKKGLNYNNPALLSQFAGAGQVGWVANWEQTMEGVPPNMHYYPML